MTKVTFRQPEHEMGAGKNLSSPAQARPFPVDIQQRFAVARPRLLRLAQLKGVTGPSAEDAVQETFCKAWQALDQLRSHERFDAWLDAICRNVCAQQRRTDQRHQHGQLPLVDDEGGAASNSFPDPAAFDPTEALTRQDLATLLDRALSHLSAGAREALTLYYLRETPQREAAQRLGVTLTVFEARLHRARRQLRAVLAGKLCAEAQAFGLFLAASDMVTWQPSRIWCYTCGQHRLEGRFHQTATGQQTLTMRCPQCRYEHGSCINVGAVPWLNGIKTFVPAVKRLWHYGPALLRAGLAGGAAPLECECCHSPLTFWVQPRETSSPQPTGPSHLLICYDCSQGHQRDWSDAFLTLM